MKPFPVAVRQRARRVLLALTLLVVVIGVSVVWLGPEIVAEFRFRKAQEALRNFDFAEAREQLRACLALRPHCFQYHFAAAQTERRAGLFRQALDHLDRCQELAGPDADVSSLERTLLHAQQGEVAQVEHPLWLLVEQNHPEKCLILEALAQGYLRVYSLPLADKALKMLVEEQPAHAEAWFLRGGTCELLGASAEGLEFYRRAVELRPTNNSYRLRLANCLLQTNRNEEAVPHLEELCRRQPKNPDALAALARAWSHTGSRDRCPELLEKALAIQPRHPQALALAAKLELDSGQFDQAQKKLEKALEADPTDRVNQYLLLQCLRQAGHMDAANKQHARLKALEKDLNRLEAIVRQELPKNPRSADLYVELGDLFARYGKPDRAQPCYQQALTCDPVHTGARQALAGLSKDGNFP
jgi:tetratricopeptide (TPR) repeat protein